MTPIEAPTFDIPALPTEPLTRVEDRLFVGHANDLHEAPLDAVLTLTHTLPFAPAPLEEYRFHWFGSDLLSPAELDRLVSWVEFRWVDLDQRVLVRDATGLNRSCVVAAAAMVRCGYPVDDAVEKVRTARGPWALSNPRYVAFLRTQSA